MSQNRESYGLLSGIMAFVIWGLIPIYFKSVENVPPFEVLGHRVFWSVLLLLPLIWWSGQAEQLKTVIRYPNILGYLVLTAFLIGGNWLIFIWGVGNGRILETSLGYFINPLLNIFLGFLFLKETLSPLKLVAIAIAFVAVVNEIYHLGKIPWVSFSLALCFGFYALIRKKTPVASIPGLAVETLVMLPIVLIYFSWLYFHNEHHFRMESLHPTLLLSLAGIITTVPLLLFNISAKKLTMTSIGILQYIGPSLSFLVGVFVYHEPITETRMVTFGMVWLALAIFSWDGYKISQNKKLSQKTVV